MSNDAGEIKCYTAYIIDMSKQPATTVDAKWTWENCRDSIMKLADRPEFKAGIRLLGYLLQPTGNFVDELHEKTPVQEKRRVQYLYSILKYYAEGTPVPVKNTLIKFNQLAGGVAKAAFSDQIERELKAFFDKDRAATSRIFTDVFHARPANYGDLAYTIEFLPGFPVTFVYHAPDEELPSEFKIFFDATANNYLPTEICDFLIDIFVDRIKQLSLKLTN